MRVKAVKDGFVVRLERGEDIIASLAALMKKHEIGSGAVTGLGAVDYARLGCYLVGDQTYLDREVEGDLEVVGPDRHAELVRRRAVSPRSPDAHHPRVRGHRGALLRGARLGDRGAHRAYLGGPRRAFGR